MIQSNSIGFLFDLDGVLIDSETEYTRIWSEIDRHFPTGVENFAIKIKGQTLPEILRQNFPESQHAEVVAMLNEREQKMKYEWLPGAVDTLEEIKRLGYECVLVTSSNDLKMKHLHEERPELENYFKEIVTANSISRSKPDPEGYLLGASILGAHPENCVVFEDSRQGVEAGKRANSYVVGLTTTLSEDKIKEFCDKTLQNLTEIDIKELAILLHKR